MQDEQARGATHGDDGKATAVLPSCGSGRRDVEASAVDVMRPTSGRHEGTAAVRMLAFSRRVMTGVRESAIVWDYLCCSSKACNPWVGGVSKKKTLNDVR